MREMRETVLFCLICFMVYCRITECSPKYFHLPVHELLSQSVYLKSTAFEEITVVASDKNSDLREDDYLTHVDGVRILNGGLDSFLKSGDKEAVVPVVDETDSKFGGNKLIGFVLIQPVTPRKLSTRRGEVVFNMEEGGAAPAMKLGNVVVGQDGAKSANDPLFQPPPHGTGPCITGRDCYFYNGSCISGQCKCSGPYTGTFCQLNRPDFASIAMLNKRMQDREKGKQTVEKPVEQPPPRIPSEPTEKIIRNLNNEQPPPPQEEISTRSSEESSGKRLAKKKKKAKSDSSGNSNPIHDEKPILTVEDLYGEGRAYPEPVAAGRLPHTILRDRQAKRVKRETFLYSVRFRSGPLGIVFDNKIGNATIVEKVVRGQQAEVSEIKEGDQLVAIESFNVTLSPAKAAQRILNDLSWPKVLVFVSRPTGEDPTLLEEKLRTRTFNLSVVYPPTLVGEYTFRLSEWTPFLTVEQSDFCPVFRLRALDDPFGCSVPPDAYRLPPSFNKLIESNGFSDPELEMQSPFLSILMRESFSKRVKVVPQSGAIMKRGICTFVEKAKTLAKGGASLGLIVNTDDSIVDMPAGRENTADCTVSTGSMTLSEGQYLHLSARTNEIWAVVTENGEGSKISPICERVLTIAEDIIDRWPHSVPPLPVETILRNKPPDQSKVRGLTEEGGRVALGGENGWAFFDYHLAMFGPQEVPLGPFRLVMALPPFGCDPNAYTVRIADAVVAILRGGGCSFGIKVINAQKLGAKAVMIVNTDDMKTMRLMALPDEVPLINIPTITVSRRIQFYLEEQIRPFSPLNHHLISIQPTGVFGDYELKNTLQLPQRLQV